MIRRLTAFIMILAMGLTLAPLDVRAAKKKTKDNEKYASLVMDADTGVILSSRYADQTRHPASLTKMMTLMLVFEALERGNISLRDRIYISRNAAVAPPSKIGLKAGSSIRVEDAILSLVTKSANDISVAIAEYLGGSESRFAQQMTRRAHDIGMSRTTFKNASGLPHKGQITTARDMARLAHYIVHRYPNYYRYFSTRTFTYQGKTYRNHNRLMETYAGMDGFKTGYINDSGFNLVASAKRNGHRLIGVVFGGRSTKTRNDHMAGILDAAFVKVRAQSPTQIASADRIISPQAAPVPPPPAKPAATQPVQVASLTAQQAAAMATPAGDDNVVRQLVRIQPELQSGKFDELTGQGDIDPGAAKRLETGMLAMAVHKNKINPAGNPNIVNVVLPPSQPDNKWAVQIGAFNSRVATDDALRHATQSLPSGLKHASPLVVPLRTGSDIIFRARLAGFSREDAKTACRYLRDCMTIAPRAE